MECFNDRKAILDRILNILQKKLKVDINVLAQECEKENLLSSKFGLSSRGLTYLFFEVEKELGIRIPQEAIISGEFSTIEGIANIILSEKQKMRKIG